VQGATPTGCSSWPRNSAVRLANSGSYMPIGIYTRRARKFYLFYVTGFHQGPPFLVNISLMRGQHIGDKRRPRARIALFHHLHSEHSDPCIKQVVKYAATHHVADRASAIGLNIRQPLSGLRSLTWPTRVSFQQTAPSVQAVRQPFSTTKSRILASQLIQKFSTQPELDAGQAASLL
jgi:hypothetical protein